MDVLRLRYNAGLVPAIFLEEVMNQFCPFNCAYKDLCNLDKENTAKCKVYADTETQEHKKSELFGYKTEDLLRMQYK